jgi:hypothetical protein
MSDTIERRSAIDEKDTPMTTSTSRVCLGEVTRSETVTVTEMEGEIAIGMTGGITTEIRRGKRTCDKSASFLPSRSRYNIPHIERSVYHIPQI